MSRLNKLISKHTTIAAARTRKDALNLAPRAQDQDADYRVVSVYAIVHDPDDASPYHVVRAGRYDPANETVEKYGNRIMAQRIRDRRNAALRAANDDAPESLVVLDYIDVEAERVREPYHMIRVAA